ncbi:MAG: hypothetical protein KIS78_10925 [Labilithrix sp.]|nr:hypothetical protein [Labilithrix sp.]MCW5832912.1 hypothetical protein [Labilithrix sp.]
MTETDIAWAVVGALVLVALAAFVSMTLARRARQRAAALRERFGPEYERAVERYGPREGQRVLAARARHVEEIELHELSEGDRARFTSAWTGIQGQFVDDPRSAVGHANELIKEVMRARGYSADSGFEQRAADLSVDHPDVVQHYRAARELAQASTAARLNTEELRQALVHYRALFADLLQPGPGAPTTPAPAHA